MKIMLFIALLLMIIAIEFLVVIDFYEKARLSDELLSEMQEKYIRFIGTRIEYPYIYKDICQ